MTDIMEGESKTPRVLRGMLGMGVAFSIIALALAGALGLYTLLVARVDWDDLDFIVAALFGWTGIAFGLGMLYGGLLALVARGRSFREVSIRRVAAAGATIGLVPALVVLVGSWINGGSPNEAKDALAIFPPLGAIVGVVTLLLARRAKNQPGMPAERDGRVSEPTEQV